MILTAFTVQHYACVLAHSQASTVPQLLMLSSSQLHKYVHASRAGNSLGAESSSRESPVAPASYKRVKGKSHTVQKRISMHLHKPHATSQPSRFSHTQTQHRLTTQLAQPLTAHHTHVSSRHQHCHCKASIVTHTLLPRDDQPTPAVHLSIPPLHQ